LRQLLERLRVLERSLQALDLEAVRQSAGQAIAQRIEATVAESLSHRPGDEHGNPWQRTGTLRASIGSKVTANAIVVGSTDPAAVFQEEGSRTVPPRPFLAPAGSAAATGAIQALGTATAEALREALR
jgi:phage gpG-like protein